MISKRGKGEYYIIAFVWLVKLKSCVLINVKWEEIATTLFHFCSGWEYSTVVTMVTGMCCARKAVAIWSASAFSPNVS